MKKAAHPIQSFSRIPLDSHKGYFQHDYRIYEHVHGHPYGCFSKLVSPSHGESSQNNALCTWLLGSQSCQEPGPNAGAPQICFEDPPPAE